ncbi:MAG: quinolinate synthase NadA [Anaerolineae bacterium]|jgi:quinolinate synthase|nr:quinolinate synthase NadA [Chloroflexota bacterium]
MDLEQQVQQVVQGALAEDVGSGDVTSVPIIPSTTRLDGVFLAKERGVLAGLDIVREVFRQVDPAIVFTPRLQDGDPFEAGDVLATVSGKGPGILIGERVALNFLQRMSGVATMTRTYVEATAGTSTRILDTRKTMPGLRLLDKLAVRLGGGTNHRVGLFDMVLIKDNHIEAAGSITAAVERVRQAGIDLPIEVEIDSLDQLDEAIAAKVDRIMLDNMDTETMRRAVVQVAGRVELEASGGVTLPRVAEIAATGVDFISVGALTHSVKALDISLDLHMDVSHQQNCSPCAESTRAQTTASAPRSHAELVAATASLRAGLGSQVTILAHHYQPDDIVQFADYTGDSLELSRHAAEVSSPCIVFCGVTFMAETAAVLCSPEQTVIQPAAEAVCPMAEMADVEQVRQACDALESVWERVIPITYQNSNADVKALVGARGGAVCTSSNARRIFEWAFSQGGRILFVPDEHLGTNTTLDLGIPRSELGIWDPLRPADPETYRNCRVVVWRGFCSVHTGFTVADVERMRRAHPQATIIVHPECPRPVVEAADASGSTAYIIRAVEQAPAGATIVVGTECNLVDRLAEQHPDKRVLPLARRACAAMAMTRLADLYRVLEGLSRGEVTNVVTVPADVAADARLALDKMLQ